jgi:CBS domain-containing protein
MANAESKARTVADIMSRPVVTATADESVSAAGARMRDMRVGSVVVVDADQAIGIFTERDVVRLTAEGAPPDDRLDQWMTPSPDSVSPDADVMSAFASLAEHGYRHIPVVDDGTLVGIVSMRDLMRIAQIQPAENLAHELPRGLEGVVVAETTIGDVRGLEGFYHYRQYDAIELAETRPLEDVWYLLHHDELPTLAQRAAFSDEIRPLREIPADVLAVLPSLAATASDAPPLDLLRTTVSLLGAAQGFRPSLDLLGVELREQALRVCAVVPTLLCALYRLTHGLPVVEPHAELPYAANYLYMMSGEVPTSST